MKLSFERVAYRLLRPHATAHGTVRTRETLVTTLTDDDGMTGFGEAAPLPSYDGVSIRRAARALERYAQVLAQDETALHQGPKVLERCRSVDDLPQALAAIDLALWDLAGKREGKPVCALLSDGGSPRVAVNATVSAVDSKTAADLAAEAVAQGFRCLKLKVGVGDDAGRVAAVRAVTGQEVTLRLDANGAWDVEQAVAAIDALSPVGLELVEEPTHGVAGIRAVRERVAARIAIDETAADPGALSAGVADAVCLKIARCGGIAGLLAAATLVRSTGAEAYVASTLDGPLGIAAALHAAAALSSRGDLPPCGLATLSLFEGLEERLPVEAGEMTVPTRPGLGVEVVGGE